MEDPKKTISANENVDFYKEYNVQDRIPTLKDLKVNLEEDKQVKEDKRDKILSSIDLNRVFGMKQSSYILFNSRDEFRRRGTKKDYSFYNYCFVSVFLSFAFGLSLGIVLMGSSQNQVINTNNLSRKPLFNNTIEIMTRTLNSLKSVNQINEYKTEDIEITTKVRKNSDEFASVSFTGGVETHKYNKEVYPKGLTEDMKDILKDNKVSQHKHTISSVIINVTDYVPNDQTVLNSNIYWGPEVENAMPQGYGESISEDWESYIDQSEVIKMEPGCGRMQNRLVTFKDGIQACVRYRQNTDQIQGEIFSFYVAKLINLTNLAPSVVRVVETKDKFWRNVASDIATAKWNSNRAVVLTQYIPSLESATIPEIFKPSTRHLNKYDVLKMSLKENDTDSKQIILEKLQKKTLKSLKRSDVRDNFDHIDMKLNKKVIDLFVELAQWSDLIIFDYLTANLDRIVNNLFNYQWNVNIMDGPAHNLARKMDSGLLLFLDNESGLLHGYRLLKKYNVYHSLMLDNLCVFRRRTIDALKKLHKSQSIGIKLSDMFHKKNNAVIRDILPPLPEKNAKILSERIGKVLSQVEKCEQNFSNR